MYCAAVGWSAAEIAARSHDVRLIDGQRRRQMVAFVFLHRGRSVVGAKMWLVEDETEDWWKSHTLCRPMGRRRGSKEWFVVVRATPCPCSAPM